VHGDSSSRSEAPSSRRPRPPRRRPPRRPRRRRGRSSPAGSSPAVRGWPPSRRGSSPSPSCASRPALSSRSARSVRRGGSSNPNSRRVSAGRRSVCAGSAGAAAWNAAGRSTGRGSGRRGSACRAGSRAGGRPRFASRSSQLGAVRGAVAFGSTRRSGRGGCGALAAGGGTESRLGVAPSDSAREAQGSFSSDMCGPREGGRTGDGAYGRRPARCRPSPRKDTRNPGRRLPAAGRYGRTSERIMLPLSATSNSGRYGLARLRRERQAG